MEHHKDYQGGYASPKAARKRRTGRKVVLALCSVVVILVMLIGGMLLHIQAEGQKLENRAAKVHTVTLSSVQEPVEETDAAAEQPQSETGAPVQTQQRTVLEKYAESYAENPEMFGWIRMEGTKLDYPVMHTPDDPQKYLHTSFEGTPSYPGVPFLDASCTEDSDNLIIYGHNMPSGTMFRSLLKYEQKNYWQEHPTITFDTIYEEQEFEVLAAFYDRVYRKSEKVFKFYQFIDAKDEADYDNAIAQFRDKSLYDTGVEAHYGDQLITLVTCAYHTENGRFVVVARKK